MRSAEIFERLSATGTAAQAIVPGIYAWGVTVAPSAWGRGASLAAKVAAAVALLMLGAGVLAQGRWGSRVRAASLWGFVLASAVVWSSAPSGLSPLRIDAPRGLAGMLGWALFAFAFATPALPTPSPDVRQHADEAALAPRHAPPRGDGAYIICGAMFAALFQVIGWKISSAERALLARFVALAAGLAIVGAAAQIALARHEPRPYPSRARRLRRAMASLVVLGILALAGLLFLTLD